ncbi:hypothetical protein THMIRHAM_17190 [Thiomicrorhabdus immobilis]|uniref:Tetratricopeptide repeat protein n=1 Tax=Thiomicrorhabdus immobilis TaxID=2791037 RepID=A0ABM7MET7_9GAMM|nr:hypothetical protein [Thiomicrorhabdus immobilis]BCN93934.1 hypothetical protein THMIRHAM_17190 [Thiomicrorhabdus immobilis]
MSVLLEALKKAADEKKNSQNLAVDNSILQGEDSNKHETDLSSQAEEMAISIDSNGEHIESATAQGTINEDKALFSLKPLESSENPEKVSESSNPSLDSILDSSADDVEPSENLPSENLKELDLTEDLTLRDSGLKLKVSPDEALKTEPSNEADNDLDSLINSLDIDETMPVGNVRLGEANNQGLNIVDSHTSENGSAGSASTSNNTSTSSTDSSDSKQNFVWSMDDLPGYASADETSNSDDSANTALSSNPVLMSKEETKPKIVKSSKASARTIVSLTVVFLFVGIGAYGMFYYQQQNKALDASMNKYNLVKMEFAEQKKSDAFNSKAESKEGNIESSSKDASTTNVADDVLLASNDSTDTPSQKAAMIAAEEDQQVLNNLSDTEQREVTQTESQLKNNLNASNSKNSPSTSKKPTPVTEPKNSRVSSPSKTVKPYRKPTDKPKVIIQTTNSTMSEAYQAYDNRDYSQAKILFNDVLAKEPNNINALLGSAGVAITEDKFYSAINFYQKVLDNEPNNLYAYEGIANLSGKVVLNHQWEQELFAMAEQYPKSAILQYTKGNLFAKKADWLEAQKSYFNAYALDSSNPDYMVNLAVSYDRLGQYKLADQYYTQALGYSEQKPVSFDPNQVKDRLISIRQFIIKGK